MQVLLIVCQTPSSGNDLMREAALWAAAFCASFDDAPRRVIYSLTPSDCQRVGNHSRSEEFVRTLRSPGLNGAAPRPQIARPRTNCPAHSFHVAQVRKTHSGSLELFRTPSSGAGTSLRGHGGRPFTSAGQCAAASSRSPDTAPIKWVTISGIMHTRGSGSSVSFLKTQSKRAVTRKHSSVS